MATDFMELQTLADAAERLGVSYSHACRLARAGHIQIEQTHLGEFVVKESVEQYARTRLGQVGKRLPKQS